MGRKLGSVGVEWRILLRVVAVAVEYAGGLDHRPSRNGRVMDIELPGHNYNGQ